MKTLAVLIRVELEVPDAWELVEHPSGAEVLKIGDEFVDFDIAPLATKSTDPEAEWTDANSVCVGKVLDMVVGLETELEFKPIE